MRVTERVRVTSIDGDRARIEILAPANPASCGTCPQSASCGSTAPAGKRSLDVVGLAGHAEGEELSVELEIVSPALAALLLFIMPMICAFGLGIVVHALSANAVLGVAGGVFGVTAAYGGVYLFGPSGPPRARPVQS